MTKKRKKPYRPKPVRVPALALQVLPDLSEAERTELDLLHRVPFDAICRGEATNAGWRQARDALQVGFIMAEAFEGAGDLRACLLLGIVALDAGALACSRGKPPAHIIEPAAKAFDVLDDVRRNLNRVETASAFYEADRRRLTGIMPYHHDAVWIVYPDDPITWRSILNEKALALVNGLPRSGYLYFDTEREALYWYSPTEDVQAVISSPLLVLLAIPEPPKQPTKQAA